MDLSETQRQTIELGKLLISFLGRGHDVDPLCRWMAHYIAEQIQKTEMSEGVERALAQRRCFETILALWKHRTSLPNGKRPFEQYESLTETLDRLNPDQPRYFYGSRYGWGSNVEDENPVSILMQTILATDRAARVLMYTLLSQAMEECSDKETEELLKLAAKDFSGNDITFFQKISSFSEDDMSLQLPNAQEKIQSQLKHLDEFHSACNQLRSELTSRLNMK